MKWEHTEKHCPKLLKPNGDGNIARTRWGNHSRKWDSLADVWSEFYHEYEEAEYPRLIIRFEGESIATRCTRLHNKCTSPFRMLMSDVLFHTEKVVDQIRECAGAKWKHDHFVHSPSAVKSNKYFSKFVTLD